MASDTDSEGKARDPLLQAVGGRIKALREERRMAPADFARAAGFSLPYLWRLEGGQQNVSLRTISRVALALEVEMAALLQGIAADPATLEKRPYGRRPDGGG